MSNEKPYWWPDARGWISIAMFVLTLTILLMLKFDMSLAKDEFFKVLASAIVVTGLLNNVTGYYFTSSKSSGELRDQVGKALDVAKEATTQSETPQPVEVVNTPADPVPTEPVEAAAPDPIFDKAPADQPAKEEDIPDYARG